MSAIPDRDESTRTATPTRWATGLNRPNAGRRGASRPRSAATPDARRLKWLQRTLAVGGGVALIAGVLVFLNPAERITKAPKETHSALSLTDPTDAKAFSTKMNAKVAELEAHVEGMTTRLTTLTRQNDALNTALEKTQTELKAALAKNAQNDKKTEALIAERVEKAVADVKATLTVTDATTPTPAGDLTSSATGEAVSPEARARAQALLAQKRSANPWDSPSGAPSAAPSGALATTSLNPNPAAGPTVTSSPGTLTSTTTETSGLDTHMTLLTLHSEAETANLAAASGSRSGADNRGRVTASVGTTPARGYVSTGTRVPGQYTGPQAPYFQASGEPAAWQTWKVGPSPMLSPDAPLPLNRAQGAQKYLPAGSFVSGTLLTGVYVLTGGNASDAPMPVLIRLTDRALLPNENQNDIEGCFVTGAATGDLSSERIQIRLDRLACTRRAGGHLDIKTQGYVVGEDGKVGLRGKLITRSGQAIASALSVGLLSGVGQAMSLSSQTTSTSALGTQTTDVTNAWMNGLGKGMSSAMNRIVDYYLKIADKIFPVIEVSSGRAVHIVFSQGVLLEMPQNEGLRVANRTEAPAGMAAGRETATQYLRTNAPSVNPTGVWEPGSVPPPRTPWGGTP
ncbi:MAG: TraB/VirB10 family protein [Sutterella sp.]|nr:TraB/VirB10 family protein [Sutterella sp.]